MVFVAVSVRSIEYEIPQTLYKQLAHQLSIQLDVWWEFIHSSPCIHWSIKATKPLHFQFRWAKGFYWCELLIGGGGGWRIFMRCVIKVLHCGEIVTRKGHKLSWKLINWSHNGFHKMAKTGNKTEQLILFLFWSYLCAT